MTAQKQEYIKAYPNLDVPVHMSPQWMDAVCKKGSWDAALVKDSEGKIEGVLVYHVRKLLGFTFILMPPFCFYNGIVLFVDPTLKEHKKKSKEREITTKLIAQLPRFAFLYLQFHHSFSDWFALYEHGFRQSTRYTYTIEANSSDEIWENMKPSLKRNINRSIEELIVESCSIDDFTSALQDAYSDRPNPFDLQLIKEVYGNLYEAGRCKLLVCKDKSSNKVLAGTLLTYDKECCYYSCGFYHPAGKVKNAISCLLWHVIKNNERDNFDFEGSMIPEIEHYFRSFGSKQKPHFRIWKINNPLLASAISFKFRNILK